MVKKLESHMLGGWGEATDSIIITPFTKYSPFSNVTLDGMIWRWKYCKLQHALTVWKTGAWKSSEHHTIFLCNYLQIQIYERCKTHRALKQIHSWQRWGWTSIIDIARTHYVNPLQMFSRHPYSLLGKYSINICSSKMIMLLKMHLF